jgi:hypothetical protein
MNAAARRQSRPSIRWVPLSEDAPAAAGRAGAGR